MAKPKLNTEAMAQELGAVAAFAIRQPTAENSPDPTPPEPTTLPQRGRTNDRPNERTKQLPGEPQRRKTRHSFDVFADQLLSLRELALERERTSGRKVLLGELVQEALDLFIAQEQEGTNV